MKKKSLPKYFVVERDETNPLWQKYIIWLNETYSESWGGDGYVYYGYDGGWANNGTGGYDNFTYFQNSPVLLTIEEWNEIVSNLNIEQPTKTNNMKEVIRINQVNEEVVDNPVEFTHMMHNKEGWITSLDRPSGGGVQYVVYLGKCKIDGDMFSVMSKDGTIQIYKGHLNSGKY